MDEETMNTIPKSEIEGLKARISGLYAQNKRLNRECVDSEVLNAVLRKEIEGLRAQLKTSKENCLTLLDTNTKLEVERDGLKASLRESRNGFANLMSTNSELRAKFEMAQEEAMDWKADCETISNSIDNGTWPPPNKDVTSGLVDFHKRLKALENISSSTTDRARQEVEKLEAENALNKVGASEWQRRENERLKDANASLRRNNEKLEARIKGLKELSEEEWLSGHPGYILFPASDCPERAWELQAKLNEIQGKRLDAIEEGLARAGEKNGNG